MEQREKAKKEEANGQQNQTDVASILARRVAVEMSDSDNENASDSEYDSDDWGDESTAWHKSKLLKQQKEYFFKSQESLATVIDNEEEEDDDDHEEEEEDDKKSLLANEDNEEDSNTVEIKTEEDLDLEDLETTQTASKLTTDVWLFALPFCFGLKKLLW